jgi:hypothetical protein
MEATGLIYDADQNITWLQTAHQDARMSWEDALTFADLFTYYDSVRDATWDDWRLPYTPGTGVHNDCASGSDEGEMGYLYCEYNIRPSNPAPFTGIRAYWYWYSASESANRAWFLNFAAGNQGNMNKSNTNEVWLVRDGDVESGTDVSDYTPGKPSLWQNYPNPFTPYTMIRFSLPKEGTVELAVYDVSGHLVKTITSRPFPVGTHAIPWDGTDDRGENVASGIYFYRLVFAGSAETKRMVLLR